MLTLIMLGLIASALPAVSGWFWGIYITSWVLWAIKTIIQIVMIVYNIRTDNIPFDLK